MIYGYARVSTAFEQSRDRNQTFDRQEMILKDHGVKEENIFCDRITGGKSTKDREAYDKLMQVVIAGDTIIVSEMSRFSRSLQDLIESVNALMERQIGIKFIKEGINIGSDGLSPMNKFIFQLFGAFAEFEKALIAERVKQGMQASKLKGNKLGRPEKLSDTDKQNIIQAWINGVSYDQLSEQYNLSTPTLVKLCHEYKALRLENKRLLKGKKK